MQHILSTMYTQLYLNDIHKLKERSYPELISGTGVLTYGKVIHIQGYNMSTQALHYSYTPEISMIILLPQKKYSAGNLLILESALQLQARKPHIWDILTLECFP